MDQLVRVSCSRVQLSGLLVFYCAVHHNFSASHHEMMSLCNCGNLAYITTQHYDNYNPNCFVSLEPSLYFEILLLLPLSLHGFSLTHFLPAWCRVWWWEVFDLFCGPAVMVTACVTIAAAVLSPCGKRRYWMVSADLCMSPWWNFLLINNVTRNQK